jgi:hypothetical protein
VSLERISALRTDTPPSNTSVLVSLIEQSVALCLPLEPMKLGDIDCHPITGSPCNKSGFLIVQEDPLHRIYWEKCGAAEL